VGGLSFTHLLLLLVIMLIFFGPSRLPQLGSSLGKAIRGFKDAMNEVDGEARDLPPNQNQQMGYHQNQQIGHQNQQQGQAYQNPGQNYQGQPQQQQPMPPPVYNQSNTGDQNDPNKKS
jgi:TatA/E family protein of Tat protein translocase